MENAYKIASEIQLKPHHVTVLHHLLWARATLAYLSLVLSSRFPSPFFTHACEDRVWDYARN